MPVVAAPIVERDVPASLRLVGTVTPQRRAVVAAEVSGIVLEFPDCEGKRFRQGEVICRLDPEVTSIRLDEARAQLGALEAQLAELESGTRPEVVQKQIAVVEEARAMYEKWEFERERVRGLFDGGRSSEKELTETEKQYRAAERRLAAEMKELERWQNGPRKEEIARARFDVAAQSAVVARLARELARTEIRAPFDGFVVAKRTEVGEWVNAGFGSSAVAEMVAIDTVRVRCDVPEAAIAFATVGSGATIEVESLGRTLSAAIARVIPLAAAAARTFPVEIDVANPDYAMLPGMFVWVHVPAGPPGKRLLASKDAIVTRGTSKEVFVIRESPALPAPGSPADSAGPAPAMMALPMAVTTGLEVGGDVEISAPGLRAGDLLVIRANERLMGPTPVTVAPAPGSPSVQPRHGPPTTTER